jgi:hypothetical protein
LPIFTDLNFIPEEVWPSSKVLKVMCIYTLSFVVLVVEGAPFCFEVKDKEIEVTRFHTRHKVVDEADFDVLDGVCKRAVISIFA